MYTLKAERRDKTVKAKKLKRQGIIPCSIFGGDLEETLLIQIPEGEAKRLLKEKGKGGRVEIECGESKYHAIIKGFSYNQVNSQVDDIAFQKLVEYEIVTGYAQVILKNKNKIPTLVQQLVKEIPYKALPEKLVETVEVDLTKIRGISGLKVEDLPIWENSDIEVMMRGEQMVLSMAKDSRRPQPVSDS